MQEGFPLKIHVQMKVDGQAVKEHILEIDDYKLEELSEDEIEQSIEIVVQQWASSQVEIEWEADLPPSNT